MNRLKTYDSTGVAPGGRLFSGDLNALQDAVAGLTDLTQHVSVADLAVGESGLLLSRFGAGEARISGAFRTDGIIRGLGGFVAGAFTTSARNAMTLPPYGLRILNTDTNREEWNSGSAAVPNWQPVGATPSTRGLLAVIPVATTVSPGSFYYATDQDSLWQSNGTSWVRLGPGHAGDLYLTLNNTADTGRVLLQGQAWPSTTGIYADLFAKWGAAFPTVLPDLRGRVPVALGTHADVNAIALNDTLAVGSRRPRHKHVVVNPVVAAHSHGGGNHNHQWYGDRGSGAQAALTASPGLTYLGPSDGGAIVASGAIIAAEAPGTTGGTVGPQTGAEPVDSAAYFVVQVEAKL